MSAQLTAEQTEKMMDEFKAFVDVATAEQKKEMLSFLEEMKECAFENLKKEIEEEIPCGGFSPSPTNQHGAFRYDPHHIPYNDSNPVSYNIIMNQLRRMAKEFGFKKMKEFIRNNKDLMTQDWARFFAR